MAEVLTASITVPTLEELANALRAGFLGNFESFSVEVVDCPDLTKEPFKLASEGLCGSESIIQVGSRSYIFPEPMLDKKYNLEGIIAQCQQSRAQTFVLGSAAGPWFDVGVMCEMMVNAKLGTSRLIRNHLAKVDSFGGQCVMGTDSCGDFAIYGNFMVSHGKAGKVLKVNATKPLTGCSFPVLIQKTLAQYAKTLGSGVTLGVGGVFIMQSGKAIVKIAPDFSKTPVRNQKQMDEYYKFYEFSSPLTCLPVILSGDIPNFSLDKEHTHCFSDHDEGGHFCGCTTKEIAKFEGYFMPVQTVYRVDKPQ